MPSPLLQLRIPQDLADWLEAKYPSRGEVAEYVRQLLTAEQMKEAVAPLVPSIAWTEDAKEILEGGFTPNEFDAHKAKPKTPFRCPDCLDPTPHERGDCPAYQPSEPKPKARRKKATVGDLESDEPIDLMVALKASVDAKKAAATQTPARCNRGACTGTINPIKGRCVRCNQTPLKESK